MMDARSLTKALGGRWYGRYGMACCPVHDDRKPSLSIRDGERRLIVNCFAGCDWQDVKAEFRRLGLPGGGNEPRRCPKTAKATVPGAILSPKIDAADDDQERRIKTALSLWKASAPLPDTLGSRYFTERRGLHIGALGDLSHALRWHEGIGAVVALMTNSVTNEPTGIHRTFLNPDGTKRERKMLGKQGVIRLTPDDEVTAGLGLTEGVEDGLAVLLSGWAPVWCATSSGAIERFPTLGGVEALTVFADDDPPGMKSAHACVSRWNDAGCEARISGLKDLRS